MTPEGKKIWNSPAGGHLMDAMMGDEPFAARDRMTVRSLVKTSKDGQGQEHAPDVDETSRSG